MEEVNIIPVLHHGVLVNNVVTDAISWHKHQRQERDIVSALRCLTNTGVTNKIDDVSVSHDSESGLSHRLARRAFLLAVDSEPSQPASDGSFKVKPEA